MKLRKSVYSTCLQTCLSLTLGLETLSMRCMKPSCCVIWRTYTWNSPYFCPLLVSPVGQYWWHTSCREERSQILHHPKVIWLYNLLWSNVTLLGQVVAEVVLTPSAYCYRIYTQTALEISFATASYPSILHQVWQHHNHHTLTEVLITSVGFGVTWLRTCWYRQKKVSVNIY